MSSYTLLANALHVHDLILNHRSGELTKPGMAAKLRLTEKKINKAIDFLRVMGYPATYDDELKRWYYDWTPDNRLNVIDDVLVQRLKKLPKADLGVLLMLQRGREFLRHTPLFGEADKFLKILDDGRLSVINHQLRDMFSYQSRPVHLQQGCFEAVASAVYERKQISFSYRKPEDKSASERRVDPHHMRCSDEMWYLIGWDPDCKEMRTFALPRMQGVTRTGKTFKSLPREKIEQQFEYAFKMVGKGGEVPPIKVRLHFSASAAIRAQERQWQVSQEVKKLPGGECEITLEVASLLEVECWVLGWRGQCTVLEPLELVENVRKSATVILSRHETP